MYVRCRRCGWSQDDFWDKDYNPFHLKDEEDILLEMLALPMYERKLRDDTPFLERLVSEATKMLEKVQHMKWWTYEDFELDPHQNCPSCQSDMLTVD